MAQDQPLEHRITLEQARTLIGAHRKSITAKGIGATGGRFSRPILDAMLAQPGCDGIRYYFARTEKGGPTIVLVGVDENGKDMEEGVIAELAKPCPPECPDSSSLLAE